MLNVEYNTELTNCEQIVSRDGGVMLKYDTHT